MANFGVVDYVKWSNQQSLIGISEYTPKPAWMQATKARAYLPRILVEKLLIKIDDMLKE